MNCEIYQVLYDKNWKDLYQYLGGNYVSMTNWLRFFNTERTCAVTGADIPNLFEQGGFAEIEEHALEARANDQKGCAAASRKIIAN
jgi:hypothetical protein